MGRTVSSERMARHTEDEAANPLDGVGEAGPEDARRCEQPPPAPPARVEPVLVPRWVQLVLLPLAIVGAYLLLHAAGPGPAAVHHRRADRAAAEPVRGAAAARAHPARRRGRDRDGRPRGHASSGSGSCSRTRSPTRRRASRATSRATSTTPTRRSPTCRTGSTGAGSTSRSSRRARPRCRRSASASPAAPATSSSFTRDAVQRLVEAGFALILLIVLAIYMLIYGDRIGAVVRAIVPPGDGTPGGRLPDARAGLAVRLRARPVPVQPDHGHERRADAVGARLARDLPGGQDVRGRVRGLVRLRRADPVRRPGDRRRSRRC